MARKYTVQNMVDRVRSLTDTQNDSHVTDAEIITFLDHAYPRTWGLLAEASPPDHMVKTATFNTVANQIQYNIEDPTIIPDLDFWKVKVVYVVESGNGGGELRPLEPINEFNRLWFRAPQAAWPVQLEYLKACPELTDPGDIVDGINGWEEHMIAIACQDVKAKKEEAPDPYVRKEKALEAEIKKLAYRDAGFPERIVRRRHHDPYYLYRNSLDGYRLRGGNLELYYRSGYRAVP